MLLSVYWNKFHSSTPTLLLACSHVIQCFWNFINSAAKINYHHLCYGQCHCNKLSASNSVLEWGGVEINNFVELVDWSSWQINLRAEIIGMYFHSDKWQMWFFLQHNIFHGYICKENIYFMQDTKEAPSPCFFICNRKGLDETIMKVISKEDWIKHPQVMEIRHRTERFCMTLLSFPLFLQLWLENPFFKEMGDWALTILYGNETHVTVYFCIFSYLETTISSAGPIWSLMENSVVHQ